MLPLHALDIKTAIKPAAAFLCFAVAMTGLVVMPRRQPPPAQPPPGWKIFRPPEDVMALVMYGDRVWAGGKDGVVCLDRRSGIALADTPASNCGHVRALLVVDNAIWIGHEKTVSVWDGAQLRDYTSADGLPDGRVLSLLRDRHGRLWVGTERGVVVRDGDGWRSPFAEPPAWASEMANVMLEDHEGGIWFGSYEAPRGGISRWAPDNKWQRWTSADGLPHANITSLCQDREGRVWAGTGLFNRGGAVCFASAGGVWHLVKVLRHEDGLAGEKVRAIFSDREGRLWFGSEYDGVAVMTSQGWRVYRESDGLSHPEIKTINQDSDGNIWLGTRSGITFIAAAALPAP